MTEAIPPVNPTVKPKRRWKTPVLVCAFLLLVLGVWQREAMLLWYRSARLERASANDKAEWAKAIAETGPSAANTLTRLFRSDDEATCKAARDGFEILWKNTATQPELQQQLATNLLEAESRFSTPGRAAAMDLLPAVVAVNPGELQQKAKTMLLNALRSDSVDVRIEAIAVCMRPELNAMELILPTLNDTSSDVRRVAMLALGPIRDQATPLITDDELLFWLHDKDAEVRRLCEMSLRGRGRTPRDIYLGRLYTSPDASTRQKLLIELAEEEDLNITLWLERLTNDKDPAVRAGAIRVAADRQTDLTNRLLQISKTDPDATVRRIATYYSSKMPKTR